MNPHLWNVDVQTYWLEQSETDVPASNDWLSEHEIRVLNAFRIPKRCKDWRLGRWTAKFTVASYLGLSSDAAVLASIFVRPNTNGAPEVLISDELPPIRISLSHRADRAACVIAPAHAELGCDLEIVEPRSDAFVADYFTEKECSLIQEMKAQQRSLVTAVLWSAKESVLKAMQVGLRVDTRSVEIDLRARLLPALVFNGKRSPQWHPLAAAVGTREFNGWWSTAATYVRTCMTDVLCGPPIMLRTMHPPPTRDVVTLAR